MTPVRYIRGAFLVPGKDIEARKFVSRREAKDWCQDLLAIVVPRDLAIRD
jgi:hypothetical protein